MADRQLRAVKDGIELVGSTHEERVNALSAAMRNLKPRSADDMGEYNALYDAYLICLAYQEGSGA